MADKKIKIDVEERKETYISESKVLLELVRKVKENGDNEAFRQIAKIMDSYLKHLSTRKFFFVPGYNSDDVYQEGLFALSAKAIPDYCESKGPFMSFAKLCIQRHIITILKSASNNKNRSLTLSISLDATAHNDGDDGPVPISDLIPSDEEDVVDAAIRREMYLEDKNALEEKLTELEKVVFELYLENLSYKEIVAIMNKRKRGKNRIDARVVDNALCRIRKKAVEIDEEND